MKSQYSAKSINPKSPHLDRAHNQTDVDHDDQPREEWTARTNNRKEAPNNRSKPPNRTCMVETKDNVATGSAMRSKYAIHEFLRGPAYRPVTSRGGEVMICVVLHSTDPNARYIIDVGDYVCSRATEATYLTEIPNLADTPPPSIKATHPEETTKSGGPTPSSSATTYEINASDFRATSPGRMQNGDSANSASSRTTGKKYTQEFALKKKPGSRNDLERNRTWGPISISEATRLRVRFADLLYVKGPVYPWKPIAKMLKSAY